MNKKTLSLAVAAAAAGVAPAGFAVQDLSATTNSNLLWFATENTVAPTGSTINNRSNSLDIQTKVGFSITDAAERYVRYDLSGATLGGALADGDLNVQAASNATARISAGGAAKDSYVIYEVSVTGAANAVSPTNNAVIALPNLTITGEGGVSISYALYSTPEAAVANEGTSLASDSGSIIGFTSAGTHGAVAVTPARIDVGQGNVYFESGTKAATTVIGAFKNTVNTNFGADVYALPNNANAINNGVGLQTIAGVTTLEVMGDFSFTQDLDSGGAPDGTYTKTGAPVSIHNGITCDGTTSIIANATSMTATKATFNLTGVADTGDKTYYVCATGNGVSTIAEQTFTGTISASGSTGVYDAESASVTLGTLSKNGTNVTLNLALTPGGAFSNFIRVVNTSGISGDVSMTVFNDSGDSVNIDMGDIDGVDSSELGAQSSTDLITVSDIYDAAVAADATFDVGTGKLRVSIDGEFTSIDAQSITLSTDNTTFTTF